MSNISTIEQADEFLKSYIKKRNSKFAPEPEQSLSAFRKLGEVLNSLSVLIMKFAIKIFCTTFSFTRDNKKLKKILTIK